MYIIMMNIKTIFITTGISMLFGAYSIYNILEYIKYIQNNRIEEIEDLKCSIDDTNIKFTDLQKKYTHLQTKYDNLKNEFMKTRNEIENLNVLLYKKDENHSDINANPINKADNIVCDELCNLNDEIPMNSKIELEFEDSLSVDYEYFKNLHNNSSIQAIQASVNSEKIYRAKKDFLERSRSRSMTDVDWVGLTKKFILVSAGPPPQWE